MKKFYFSIILIILIFIIYIFNKDRKIYYVNISNEGKYYNSVVEILNKKNILEKSINLNNKNYRITDIYNNILNNKKINKKQTYQNALIKADILTIELGKSELNYKIKNNNLDELYDYVDELIDDLDKLFNMLRSYDKETIYFVKYEEPKNYYKEIYKYLNLKVEDLCSLHNIKLVSENYLKTLQLKK